MRVAVLVSAVCAASVALAGPVAATDRGKSAARTVVTVDLRARRQVIDGFGSSTRVWSDPHVGNAPGLVVPPAAQSAILTSLYRRLGLTRVRNLIDQGVQKSKGGPFDFSGKLGADQVAFVKQARAYGLRTFFPAPVYLEDWMTPDDVGSYVDYAMAVLRRWRALGAEPPLYAPLNEPAISHDFPPEWMRQVVIQLGRRLRAEGFETKLVIPDDENPTDAYRRAVAVLDDPAARPYVGAVAYHVYKWDPDAMIRLRQLAARYGLPVWMTEYSDKSYADWRGALSWAVRMHELLTDGGVGAVDYLFGFFGSWTGSDTLISIDFGTGAYRGFSPTPPYWVTGQYSRYVRPGYMRVAATPASGRVLVSAYRGPRRAVVVATNPSGRTETLTVRVTGGKLKGAVRPVRSSPTEQWRSLAPIQPRNGLFTASLPPESVTTFVATR
jgi:glucuronoarabinoxylan endo-1,4-beta-xylanase